MRRFFSAVLCAALLVSALAACASVPGADGEESRRTETFADGDAAVTFTDAIAFDAYPADTPAGEFLAGCTAVDRDEQFSAYVLRHSRTDGDRTTHTYLVYYRHGEAGMTATPTVSPLSSGSRIDLTYTPGDGTAGYSLCRLSVTLPTPEPPHLSLVLGKDTVGTLLTVSDTEIPLP